MKSFAHYLNCDFTDAEQILPQIYKTTEEGFVHFACPLESNCEDGQKIRIEFVDQGGTGNDEEPEKCNVLDGFFIYTYCLIQCQLDLIF